MNIDWPKVQSRLGVAPDGKPGPVTFAMLFTRMAGRDLGDRDRDLGIGMAQHWRDYGMDDALCLAHFLGQTAHESGLYHYLREIWGPTTAQKGYEGRQSLGNTKQGDGKRYLGRGLIQLTGRSNYAQTSERIGIDLVASPELAERPDIAVLTALDWWQAHNCNKWAKLDAGQELSRLINRGDPNTDRPANGEDERRKLTRKAKDLLA
jgi:putative chitinase